MCKTLLQVLFCVCVCMRMCVCLWFSFDSKGTSPDFDHLWEVAVYLKNSHLILMCLNHFTFELITILQIMHLYLCCVFPIARTDFTPA